MVAGDHTRQRGVLAGALVCGLAAGCARTSDDARDRAAPESAGLSSPADPPAMTAVPDDERARAKQAFFDAVPGDAQAVERSRKLWQIAYDDDGQNTEAAAYLGASTVLAAAHARWPWDKGNLAKQGMALLDRAVAEQPENLEVRFLRGMTNYRLPGFLGRTKLATEDLQIVAGRAQAAADSGDLPRPLAAAALYHYGLLLEGRGDRAAAAASFREAGEVGPDTPGGRAAAGRLAAAAAESP